MSLILLRNTQDRLQLIGANTHPLTKDIQQVLRTFKVEPGHDDLGNLVLIDPALATIIDLQQEWQQVWCWQPATAVRRTLLWHKAPNLILVKGKGCAVPVSKAQELTVGR